jgi:hypothetical protein
MALNGFQFSWEPFVKGIYAQEKTFLNFRGLVMIVSRKRLGWSQTPTRRMVKRT